MRVRSSGGLRAMTALEFSILLVGAAFGGFASGLTGFGYSLVALGIWLHVLPAQIAVPVSVLCSTASQVLIMPRTWRSIEWRKSAAFIMAGLAGVPVGAEFLSTIDASLFKRALGLFLVAYAGVMLMLDVRWKTAWGSGEADVSIGFAGGILGGVAGLSGSIMVVWAALMLASTTLAT